MIAAEVQILYKYGRVNEYSESIFSTPRIWFSPPLQLNDPFECQPWFTFEGSQDQIVELLARGIKRRFPYITNDDATANAVAIYLQGRHRNSQTWDNLRRDLLERLSNDIGLYCLSSDNSNILMWSHYADFHRGYCLGFEATNETPMFGTAQEVRYQENFPVIDVFNTPNAEQVDLIFLTKYQDWCYENEWRIIDHDNGSGIREYPAGLLKTVTFGLRMPEQDQRNIKQWVKARGHEIEFYKAVRDDQSFKINLIKLD